MPTHKYLEPPNRQYLINNLAKLLKYHNINYSQSEINSYNKKELRYLIYKFKIRLNNATSKNNRWYRESKFN